MRRPIPINEAEAIFEPFWDGGSSEHPKDKASLLGAYRIDVAPTAVGRIWQWWMCVVGNIERAAPGGFAIGMERDYDLSLDGYDVFRVSATLPPWVRMTVRARIDGRDVTLLDRVSGPETAAEFDAPFSGQRLEHLRLEFAVTQDRPAEIYIFWLGLANRAAQTALEARTSPYTADWPLCLRDEPDPAEPQIGIFFGPDELAEMRNKCLQGPLKGAFARLRAEAQKDLALNPEAEVGRFIPYLVPGFVRTRDKGKTRTAGLMERLAFVGLIDGNLEMSRMAARMALAAAHCEYWCESPMGVFPGATWHHRSFTEEIYCRGCGLVLDWAGFCLTQHAQQIVRDAIVMKGLARIESDFKRMEYIRSMNQGIAFSSGRIIGLLSLLPAYPRYQTQLAEAEKDLREMIEAYVHDDGGTLEGMAYWNYSFSTSVPLFYVLARQKGKTLREFVPEAVRKTGDYALAMLSTTGDGTTYLPINDAHSDNRIALSLVGAYTQMSDRPEWTRLYANMMQSPGQSVEMYDIIMAPATIGTPEPMVQPRFDALCAVGQASSVRADPRLGHVHFHLCSGPGYSGHYHQDKGSFILEAAGEALAIDRGISRYDHPETGLLKIPARHNLLCPEHPQGGRFVQPGDAPAARLTSALQQGDALMLASDNAATWEPGVFAANVRRVFSPTADLYLIDDEVELAQPLAVSFRLNSLCPLTREGDEWWVRGQKAALRIVPLNWTPVEATIAVEGIDDHLRPVNLLRLLPANALRQRLLTALEVVPVDGGGERWQLTRGERPLAKRGAWTVEATLATDPALQVVVREGGVQWLAAAIKSTEWLPGK